MRGRHVQTRDVTMIDVDLVTRGQGQDIMVLQKGCATRNQFHQFTLNHLFLFVHSRDHKQVLDQRAEQTDHFHI